MSIAVTCPQCSKSFRVKDDQAGKRGKCPNCQGVIQVPAAPSAAAGPMVGPSPTPAAAKTSVAAAPGAQLKPSTRPQASGPSAAAPAAAARRPQPAAAPPSAATAAALEQEILGAFQGEIARVRTPIVYRLATLLVAAVMVILPLVYLALIALAGYAVYWHAVNDTAVLGIGRGRGRVVALVIYLTPFVVGAILLMFMVKPLFARPARARRTRSLTRTSDPLLFAFVDRVCAAVRASKPKRIDVDCEVNASASFRRGLSSMLGRDLVLTIGLPLAGGLSLRQFAGVLAHEFGHFTQGVGMRLTYLIRSVSWWFTRVVYERDRWDQWLIDTSQDSDWRIAIVLYLARFFVWLTRRVLWVLMMIGHMVSGFMLRQMEFDADRHEARLAGSDAFESTVHRLALLNMAHAGAQADLGSFYQEGRLADNLPRLIMANVGQIPAELRAKLQQSIAESRTRLLDTHPSDKDRIARARREKAPGVFHSDRPAHILFSDFDALARNVTWDVYCGIFGVKFRREAMHPTEELLARQSKEDEARRALVRYFQGAFSPLRPLPLAGQLPAAAADPRACAARLRTERQRMLQLKPTYEKSFATYDQADTHTIEADQAVALGKADFKVRRADFSLDLTSLTTASRVRREAGECQERTGRELAEFEKAAAGRLSAALALLQVPQVGAKIDDAAAWLKQCERILPALKAISTELPWLLTMRNEHAVLGILLSRIQGNERNEQLIVGIERAADALATSVRERRNQLDVVRYPLDHAKGEISLGQYVLADIPTPGDLGAVMGAGQAIVENALTLYARLLGRLAVVAEKVEKALGLDPLPEPHAPDEAPAGTA